MTQPKMDKFALYHRSFSKALSKAFVDESALDRAILYGVRTFNSLPKSENYEVLINRFQFVEVIKSLMMWLTPKRFVNIFPIKKTYNGKRYEIKDYFSTVQAINEHGWDELIQAPTDFLWDFYNDEICEFMVNQMCLVSDIMRAHGQPGLLEQWAQENGVPIFRMYTDENEKEFLIDQNGRSKPVKKARPKHLKLVNGRDMGG